LKGPWPTPSVQTSKTRLAFEPLADAKFDPRDVGLALPVTGYVVEESDQLWASVLVFITTDEPLRANAKTSFVESSTVNVAFDTDAENMSPELLHEEPGARYA